MLVVVVVAAVAVAVAVVAVIVAGEVVGIVEARTCYSCATIATVTATATDTTTGERGPYHGGGGLRDLGPGTYIICCFKKIYIYTKTPKGMLFG